MNATLPPAQPPPLLQEHTVTWLDDGTEAFPAMLEAIRGAERHVLLEMYWLAPDEIGDVFCQALAERARAGVSVYVMLDAFGSMAGAALFRRLLEDAGVHLIDFNPIGPWRRRFRLDRMMVRDHRKLLIVDDAVGFVGGVNLAAPWLAAGEPAWRDAAVAVTGPTVLAMRTLFVALWRRETGRTPTLPDVAPAPASWHDASAGPLATFERVRADTIELLAHGPLAGKRSISRAFLDAIRSARERIWITNSYFVPDRRFVRALRQAARRGVDVRLIVPGRSDVAVVAFASQVILRRLARAGVQVYAWTHSVLHAKTAVIDGHWVTVGTLNLDHRSLDFNHEVNVAVHGRDVARAAERQFEADLARCAHLDRTALETVSLLARVLQWLAYQLRTLI